jgi:SNF2 family DNA or RNA helicase
MILSVNWNPSYDEQAQDRSYRIGQENDVEVIRLVARGTIEEQMYARQVYKVQLKKQTLGGNVDGKAQPQIFRGCDKDKDRKGELFGIENLLMYRGELANHWQYHVATGC